MLKKIAHNSTIPSLGGNRDLKPLQNLIAAEKTVLISLQKLSVDYSKASEALRTWGLTEGDYLGGILSASTSILNHFSSALSQYAEHGHSMRDHLKAIRTREESLDDLERRRRSILRKAEEADKKLSKMAPGNKHFTTQTEVVNRLRDDIQTLNSDVMSEEAALDKFKRSATKVWMGLKFGGLVECCQKGTIAGEFGRLAIVEISEDWSQPGLPRSFAYPQNKIENFVAEAYRGVNMVTLCTFPTAELHDRVQGQYDLTSSDTTPTALYVSAPTEYGESSSNRLPLSGELQPPPTTTNGSRRVSESAGQPSQTSTTNDDNTLPSSQQLGVNEGDSDVNVRSTGPQYQQQLSQGTSFPQTLPSSQQYGANEGAVDDFGANIRSTGPPQFHSVGSPHPQQFSQGTVSNPQALPPIQQLRVNESAMDDLNANVRSTSPFSSYQQQYSQGTYSHPSYSQTLPPPSSQQFQVNEDNFGANVRSSVPPYQQRFSQEATNPSSSQTLPSSRQLGANEGAVDDFGVNTHYSPPYQQRFSDGNSNSSFSQTLPAPSQQIRVNEGSSRPAAPPYEQHFSQTLPPSSQQYRVNEGVVDDDIGPSVHSPQPQRFFQGIVNPSQTQTLPPSQQLGVNEFGAVGPNVGLPHPQQFSQTLPPSQQIRANDESGVVDNIGLDVRSTVTQAAYPQQWQGPVSPLYSQTQTLPSSIRANEGAALDNFGHPNVRSTVTAHPQHRPVSPLYSQSQTLPSSQQIRANEGAALDNFGPNVRSTVTAHPQQRPVSPLYSQSQTLPSSQQIRVNEEAALDSFGPNVRSTDHPQQGPAPGGLEI